jgi:uncharacterized protein
MIMKQYSLIKSILFHLVPGILVVILYIILAPLFQKTGYPPLIALAVAAVLGIVPLQLGHLFYLGYKQNQKLSLKGIVIFGEKLKSGKFLLWLLLSLVLLFLIGGVTINVETVIKIKLFAWLPNWFFYDSNLAGYSRETLLAAFWVKLIIDGFLLPVTEELYFRGFLYHRLPEQLKNKWFVAALLFAIYHFWQPWNYISLFFISLVLVWPVYKLKNVYLSITIHVLANIIGTLLFFGQLMQAKS